MQELIARSRSDFAQASLLLLETAWLIDRHGAKVATAGAATFRLLSQHALPTRAWRPTPEPACSLSLIINLAAVSGTRVS
ncbi:hypothetical protein OG800_01390 [Streptomyces sp. NBC_00445]|uniref:hypothetical protein n=1 Tax=unclassified Streptomyces TaxID=2593676 RepID=UPI002E1EA233